MGSGSSSAGSCTGWGPVGVRRGLAYTCVDLTPSVHSKPVATRRVAANGVPAAALCGYAGG
jgi:hypothetical protein